MKITVFLAVGLLVLIIVTACASKPKVESGSVVIAGDDVRAAMVFSAADREKIVRYYKGSGKSKKVPPGLAGKKELPPGLQQHIKKHGELPPGLEGQRLPADLEQTLSRLPAGYIRIKLDGDVVLLDEKTRFILDVIWNLP
ncbi:MAG: hypothetical protein JRD64_00840 [Deltaproteobacteria bacterium]|nr:hypothetical protein [Deltaproteobacteria bacterium]